MVDRTGTSTWQWLAHAVLGAGLAAGCAVTLARPAAAAAPPRAVAGQDPARVADDSASADDAASPQSDLEAREQAAAAKVSALAGQLGDKALPTAMARLAHTRALLALGRYPDAITEARTALGSLQAGTGGADPRIASAQDSLGLSLTLGGAFGEGEGYLRAALSARTQAGGFNAPQALSSAGHLATNLRRQGRFAEAIRLLRPTVAALAQQRGPTAPATLSAMLDLAEALGSGGSRGQAELLVRKVIDGRRAALGDRDRGTLAAVFVLADLLGTERRHAEALPLFNQVRDQRSALLGPRHPDTLIAAERAARSLAMTGHAAEAEPAIRQIVSTDAAVLGASHPTTLVAMATLARVLREEGKAAESQATLREILARRTVAFGADSPVTLSIRAALASELSGEGRLADAEAEFTAIIAARRRQGADGRSSLVPELVGLGLARLRQPARAALAVEPLREAVAILRARRAHASFSPLEDIELSRETVSQAGIYRLLADADWAAMHASPGNTESLRNEAFAALQDAMDGTVTQSFARAAARAATAARGDAVARLVEEREALADRWRARNETQEAVLATASPGAASRTPDETTAQIAAQMATIDGELDRVAPEYFALTRPAALGTDAAHALLRPDEAILLVVPSAFGTHVMLVDERGIAWNRADLTRAQVVKLVGRLRSELNPEAIARNHRSFSRKLAFQLYAALLAPLEERLGTKTHVLVAADGALASLPFEVLVTGPPAGSDDDAAAMRATGWFGDRHALTQLPSLQVLAFIRRYRPASPGKDARFEGFGDPLLQGPGANPQPGPLTSVALLSPLPGTAGELRNMATALHAPPAQVHLGAQASQSTVTSLDLSQVRVLAFATHGLLPGQLAGSDEPGLVLTPPAHPDAADDGYLSASKIAQLRLRADLVILSACNSGAGDGEGTPPLSGLARAFFSAGARALLVSHWPVYDDVAPRITVELLAARDKDPSLGLDRGLQRAIAAVRNDPADPSLAFPSAWAPFVVVGDWKN